MWFGKSDAVEENPLEGLTGAELDILRTLKRSGALLEPELPLKLNRISDDLTPELRKLRDRKLVEVRTVEHYGEKMDIYLTSRDIDRLL